MPDIRQSHQLDDFNRPNEHPILPPWLQLDTGGTWSNNHLHSGAISHPSEGGTPVSWSYWSPEIMTGDFEVWGYPTGGEAGAAGTGWRLGFWRVSTAGGASTASGYLVLWFTALGDACIIRRYSNPTTFVNIASNGDSHGGVQLFRKTGSLLEAFTSFDNGANWTLNLAVNDPTYANDVFYLGVGVEDPTFVGTGWNAIGGGSKAVKPQIYRILGNTS